MLGMSYPTVWRLVQLKKIRPLKGFRSKFIPKTELERYIRENI